MRPDQVINASPDLGDVPGLGYRLATLGLMTAGVVHDLRNHLQVAAAAVRRLEQRAALSDCDDLHLSAAGALDALHRATTLSRRILAFSHDEGSAAQLVDLNDVLTTMADPLRWTAGPGVRLHLELNCESAVVACDPQAFENAILNLVVNARDALPDEGNIVIAVRSEPVSRSVLVAVSDDGTGMDADIAERVFEPFFSTKRSREAAGLGMSLVADFARRNGGEARLESRPGLGTTVVLRIPEAASSNETDVCGTRAP